MGNAELGNFSGDPEMSHLRSDKFGRGWKDRKWEGKGTFWAICLESNAAGTPLRPGLRGGQETPQGPGVLGGTCPPKDKAAQVPMEVKGTTFQESLLLVAFGEYNIAPNNENKSFKISMVA